MNGPTKAKVLSHDTSLPGKRSKQDDVASLRNHKLSAQALMARGAT